MALPTLSGLTTSVYGTNASNAVSYAISEVNSTMFIEADKFTTMATKVNLERTRRGYATTGFAGMFTGDIESEDMAALKSAIEVDGPAATEAYNTDYNGGNNGGLPPAITTFPKALKIVSNVTFTDDTLITADGVNELIRQINNSGAACTCNCNYCTCNCNYCTCNCNYACTCHCNYSDERVKTEIEYM